MTAIRTHFEARWFVVGLVAVLGAALLWLTLTPDTAPKAPAAQSTGVAPAGRATVDGLQAPLRRSIGAAVRAARAEGIDLRITSGWRSVEEQAALFDEAVAKYGSAREARRWVLPPDESAHVSGEAVDVGPRPAALWLAARGAEFGLCQRYAHEPWHFERLTGPGGSECPAPRTTYEGAAHPASALLGTNSRG